MPSLLEQLMQYSVVVADTGDLDAIRKFNPVDATTNPSLVLKAVQSGQYDALVQDILGEVKAQFPNDMPAQIEQASDRLTVSMGAKILEHVPGRVSTEVDAKLSFDREGSIEKAHALIELYKGLGISTDRVLIKLAATWEGIRAAEVLEQEGIQCNLTLIFSPVQAQACADANVFLISPFVGRILDWYKKQSPDRLYPPAEEPGVVSVRDIYRDFHAQGKETIVMGASFRNVGEIIALAGCDRLTISPNLLEELAQTEGTLERALIDDNLATEQVEPIGENEFRWKMNDDAMATEKLAEGIRGFAQDQKTLEALLSERLLLI